MTYKIAIDPKHLAYIGKLLDRQPHGEVAAIVSSIQGQIDAQDAAVKEEQAAARLRAQQEWLDAEIERRTRESAPPAQQKQKRRRAR